jgi:hypothetical protein
VGAERELDLAAGGDQDQLRLLLAVGEHVAAAAQPLRGGVARAVEDRHGLAGEDQRHRVVGAVDREPPGLGGLVRVGGTDHVEMGDRPQRGQLLDRLVGRPVLAEADRVVGEEVDHRQLHQGREADARAAVVGEGEVGGPEWLQLREREAVACRGGRVFADPEVDLTAGEAPRLEVDRAVEVEPHRGRVGEVGGAGDHPRDPLGDRVLDLVRGLAGRQPLLFVRLERGDRLVPAFRQPAALHRLDLGRKLGLLALEGAQLPLPLGSQLGTAPADLLGEALADAVRDEELSVLGPAVGALGQPHLLLPQRFAMGGLGVLLVRRAPADVAVDDDQGRPADLGLEGVEGAGEQSGVVGVPDPEHVPAVALEATEHVVAVGEAGVAVDRDVVVVVEPAEVVELEVAGEGGGLVGDALHQAAVAGERVDVEVEELGAEALPLPLGGKRHPDRGGDALAERARGRLDPGGPAVLRVSRRARAQLAELFDLVQADRRLVEHVVVGVDLANPGQVEDRVDQHRGMPGREHEAVAVGPGGVCGVVAEVVLPELVGDRRQRHRRPGVAGARLLHRVDREGADGVYGELVDVLIHARSPILATPDRSLPSAPFRPLAIRVRRG